VATQQATLADTAAALQEAQRTLGELEGEIESLR